MKPVLMRQEAPVRGAADAVGIEWKADWRRRRQFGRYLLKREGAGE